jgi:hypothetical protein
MMVVCVVAFTRPIGLRSGCDAGLGCSPGPWRCCNDSSEADSDDSNLHSREFFPINYSRGSFGAIAMLRYRCASVRLWKPRSRITNVGICDS